MSQPNVRLKSSLRALCVIAVMATALAAIRNNAADPDLWGHVQYGREVLQSGALPEYSSWSFTSSERWINHENLAELALAWTSDTLGAAGLGLAKLLITIAVFAAMMQSCLRRGASFAATAIVVVLAAECMQFHWHFRPHLFGFALFAALLWHLDWCFEPWCLSFRGLRGFLSRLRRTATVPAADSSDVVPARPTLAAARLRSLWIGPVILCLWTNTHGSFMAGLAIWCTYLVLRIVEARAAWGGAARPVMQRLAISCVAGIFATFLNPYGPTLHIWLLQDVWVPRPEITDWQPLAAFGLELWSFWGLLLLCGWSLWRDRHSFRLTETVVLVLVAWQALSHVRHALFFAILCGFWLPNRLTVALNETADRFLPSLQRFRSSRILRFAVAATAFLWIAGLTTAVVPSYTTVRVDRGRYPVDAMSYMFERRLFGRTVVAFNWAQYAIGCFGSDPVARQQARVAIDGRLRTCYPQEVIDLYLDLFLGEQPPEQRYRSPASPCCEPARALDWKSPDLLLIERHNPHCRSALDSRRQDWVLLYQDQLAQIWGRRNRYDDVTGPDFIPLSHRRIGDSQQSGSVSWPAVPIRSQNRRMPWLLADRAD